MRGDPDPNMQASFDKKTSQIDVREVNVDLFLGWKDGRLIFDNCSLEDILKDLGNGMILMYVMSGKMPG